MNDELEQKTDDELNDRFAVEVAGWRIGKVENKFSTRFQEVVFWPPKTNRKKWPFGVAVPKFTTDANAILPWLEKWHDAAPQERDIRICRMAIKDWLIVLRIRETQIDEWKEPFPVTGPLARAAVIALIRASRSKG